MEQPLSDIREFDVPATYQNVIISGREFFDSIQNPSGGQYFYSSGGVELLQLPLVSVEGLANITFPPHKGPGQVNYWFGGSNVTAYNHYDTSHNLHLVIRGKKRFLLYPPSDHNHLHLYPCLHSLYRQTQVTGVEPYAVVDVLPGQVLYLPPYWFHTVITVDPSISLNIWTDSQDYLLMEDILTSPIPFEGEWSQDKLLRAAKHFIESLLDSVKLPKSFIKDVVFKRYESLVSNIPGEECEVFNDKVQSFCQALSSVQTKEYIHNRAGQIGALFTKMSTDNIMEINVANYIEHITYTLLQSNVKALPFYFNNCFKR
jgi:hypothetical protein